MDRSINYYSNVSTRSRSQQLSKSGGLYNLNADQNLAELKAIMKELLIKEVTSSDRPAVWTADRKPYSAKKAVSTQTDATGDQWEKSESKAGSGVWTFVPPRMVILVLSNVPNRRSQFLVSMNIASVDVELAPFDI
ncbi:hypothetical protein ON010_g7048 [Phytophthora cinnamomi]|nr:hypothetical protein ON010_g7048 [Phytophthora cinnamomi]